MVNAAEQAKNFQVASKIAAIVNLFKSQFVDVKVDLKPWMNDPDTLELVDPDSIDIGFHLPGRSRSLESRCLLVQIRLYQDPIEAYSRVIGVEVAGYDHRGEQWKLSTVGGWHFVGNTQPTTESAAKLKYFCRQIFELFNNDDLAA
ncbi:MAG: hypothetical protein F6K18_20600 [Okeania sp. SIO2C2]|uniref:hypothetical protein n=1 Tax=unclassified Okeania TaxID=2634635 RepID=UPI0013BDFC1D|nr:MULTISPECIES: hypothetical protein [unclassified Okeania]NEP06537.1 hypothetical protein [Okeania sp. SIO4D6]NEP42115.1 hypothetical protein [Okeania sp. SIO2H7]NEP72073.1 hypothetical protein [Okeania sp. SIO2G5]NEP89037.1 hypothetical protein [Okeania sp. SIO2C2]NEP92929.1 hypothetical protein [Okeania sp. SIO2F5]